MSGEGVVALTIYVVVAVAFYGHGMAECRSSRMDYEWSSFKRDRRRVVAWSFAWPVAITIYVLAGIREIGLSRSFNFIWRNPHGPSE
jgi:hypothetical protein